jgi:hypothetical protein
MSNPPLKRRGPDFDSVFMTGDEVMDRVARADSTNEIRGTISFLPRGR